MPDGSNGSTPLDGTARPAGLLTFDPASALLDAPGTALTLVGAISAAGTVLVAEYAGEFDAAAPCAPGMALLGRIVAGRARASHNRFGSFGPPSEPGPYSLLVGDGERHWRSDGVCVFRHVFLAESDMVQVCEDLAIPPSRGLRSSPEPFAAPSLQRVEALLEARVAEGPICAMEADAWRTLFAAAAVRAVSVMPSARQAEMLSPALLGRVLELMRARVCDNPGLAEIAAAVGMAPLRFARAFRATTGESPHSRLRAMKVEAARRMIETTDQPLAEIAYASGFSSQAHMTSAFRAVHGATPGRWRLERRA